MCRNEETKFMVSARLPLVDNDWEKDVIQYAESLLVSLALIVVGQGYSSPPAGAEVDDFSPSTSAEH
jgi:hypothetical protein